MAILAAIVDVLDDDGASVVPSNSDGTRPLVKLAVDDSLTTTATRSGDTVIVTLGGGGGSTPDVLAAIAGQAIAPASITTTEGVVVDGNVTVGGLLIQGGSYFAHGSATTTGGVTPATLSPLTIPLANNSGATVRLTLTGISVAAGLIALIDVAFGVLVVAGTPTILASNTSGDTTVGLPVSFTPSWSAGFVHIAVLGPIVHITGTVDFGGTAVLITVQEAITSAITGQSVTIAGASGTPGLNGVHVATYAGADSFTVAVVYVAPDTSGTAVLAPAPTIAWSAVALAVVAPVP